jgi:LAO/AO transport system kinase
LGSVPLAPKQLSSVRPELVEGQPEKKGKHSEEDCTLIDGLKQGQRRALAKAITLVESARTDHQQRARGLLQALLPDTGKSIRVGISGVPGVGKSTFIEALGLHLIGKGHRVAVLAVDPSSTVTGGSILGDKTRMEHLAQREEAFIRPSPSSGALGGVADRTRETMLLCEAAGFDIVIVETVGVGQSETAVAGMTDSFVLLQLPNAGDDLQAIKKGIVELADIVVYNKADIDLRAVEMAASQMRSALALLHPASPHWRPPVLMTSAARKEGVAEFWETVLAHRAALEGAGELARKRRHQSLAWMWALIDSELRHRFREDAGVRSALDARVREVEAGMLAPAAAADHLLSLFSGKAGAE